jgi:hypothetical protein
MWKTVGTACVTAIVVASSAVLTRPVTRQPVAGVEIIALGEHVDYWDRLGWRDPFSSSLFTSRQSQYDAPVFHGNSIYTPPIVVDAVSASVGSDAAAVQRAIQKASRRGDGGDSPRERGARRRRARRGGAGTPAAPAR